jgi:hypothetical protein
VTQEKENRKRPSGYRHASFTTNSPFDANMAKMLSFTLSEPAPNSLSPPRVTNRSFAKAATTDAKLASASAAAP